MRRIETATGPAGARYLHNPVFEIEVAEGARLTHGRIQQEAPGAFQLSTVYATVAAGGTYDNFTLNAGARLVRNEIHAALTGPIVRGDVRTVEAHLHDIGETAPATIPSYVAMAKATADRAVLDGRLLPIRAAKLVRLLDEALVRVGEAGPAAGRPTGAVSPRRSSRRASWSDGR